MTAQRRRRFFPLGGGDLFTEFVYRVSVDIHSSGASISFVSSCYCFFFYSITGCDSFWFRVLAVFGITKISMPRNVNDLIERNEIQSTSIKKKDPLPFCLILSQISYTDQIK